MPNLGYQDWQRVNFAAGNVIGAYNAAITVSANVFLGPVFAWPYLQCFLQTPAGSDAYQVIVGWYADSGFLNQVASDTFIIGPSNVLQMALPVQAPFVVFRVNPKAGGNNAAVIITCYGTSLRTSTFASATLGSPLVADESTYAINQQKILPAPNLYYGKGRIAASSSANNPFKWALQYYSYNGGGYVTLERWGDISGNLNLHTDVFLPAAPVQIVVTNGGVAQDIYSFLYAMPGD